MISWPKLTCKLNKSLMTWFMDSKARTDFPYCTKILNWESTNFIRILKVNSLNFEKEHSDKRHKKEVTEYKAEKILKLHGNKNDKNLNNAKFHVILEI